MVQKLILGFGIIKLGCGLIKFVALLLHYKTLFDLLELVFDPARVPLLTGSLPSLKMLGVHHYLSEEVIQLEGQLMHDGGIIMERDGPLIMHVEVRFIARQV